MYRYTKIGGEILGENQKVVKFKKRRTINIGVIVFLILFLYIAINVYIYFTKEQLSIYEVHEGSTALDNRITGLILRDEEIVYSTNPGFVTYFQKEGARVAKNAPIYSMDDDGQMMTVLTNGDIPISLSAQNNAELHHDIRSFQKSFSDDNFSKVYDFKEKAKSTVLDILNNTVITHGQQLTEETGINYAYNMVPCEGSGVITYYMDSLEEVTPDMVTPEMFQLDNYVKNGLRTTEMVGKGEPVYKIITSEEWNIILPLTKVQYEKLADKERVSFTILEDEIELKAPLTLIQKGEAYYAQLTLDKHLTNYLEKRFIDVKLDFDTVVGLKIPLTSIIEKDFYLVPLEYFSVAGESNKNGLIKEVFDEKTGDITFEFVPADIYYQDEAYGYIDTELFTANSWIHSPMNNDRYSLTQMNKLTGVYNVNLGYAVFKRIEPLYQNEEYCIVKKDTPNGLSAYDHIALDGSTAVEQQIIY
jgi:hypothetical protein